MRLRFSPMPPADPSALRSAICHLDADRGRLTYRGHDVRELAEHATFEDVAHLLVHGALPDRVERKHFTGALRVAAPLSRESRRLLQQLDPAGDDLFALRTAVSALPLQPPGPEGAPVPERLIAQVATLVAARHRLREGLAPVRPRRSLGFAANVLHTLTGAVPAPALARAFDAALILRADNELNPSAFAARVTTSTAADLYGAVTAALAALAGPRHGAHSANALDMLLAVGEPDAVAAWVEARLAAGGKFPGFGHPVYRGEDPRTATVRRFADGACEAAGHPEWFALARALEERVVERTGQYANVDYYLATLYRACGLPRRLYGPVFAVARITGWLAHCLEQATDPDLIRPRAEYVGPDHQDVRPAGRRRARAS
ncbi:MAG: citrate/2-methylcitrate synthase [Gemmatimonadales bacterium]|nr:citrate/2-methylcitrate synthase [Gemmatimonadales bacterium]